MSVSASSRNAVTIGLAACMAGQLLCSGGAPAWAQTREIRIDLEVPAAPRAAPAPPPAPQVVAEQPRVAQPLSGADMASLERQLQRAGLAQGQLGGSQRQPLAAVKPAGHAMQVAQAEGAGQESPTAQVARLGVVDKDQTPIYRQSDLHSQKLFRCGKGTALGLVGHTARFYAVLMVDKSLGFVEKARVQLYNYNVAVDPKAAQAAEKVVNIALEYIGIPYVWGGNGPRGIDCSGFVKSVFARMGVELPRVARDQFNVGRPVRWGELAPGDRLYFCSHGPTIDHTGIYIGGGRFIHASGSAGAVVVSSVTEPKYFRTLVGAKRI